jgi:[glutamine synthetase] adenylyltransferase / [glutamine synthetase]-adenylyl-L-tyrosine phosphorylase
MRSAQARERLTEITPVLLKALSKSGDPDGACFAFDRFLGGLPGGLQLFSLLRANPHLLDLLATILGSAPRLAQELSHRPKLFDAVIEPDFFTSLPSDDELRAGIAEAIPDDLPLEEVLERARVFGKEQMFRIGVQVLAQAIGPSEAGAAHSRLADAFIARLLRAVERDIEARHGPVPGGRTAVLAMGKLGGREMAPDSDLDLILVYDHDPGVEASTGPKAAQRQPVLCPPHPEADRRLFRAHRRRGAVRDRHAPCGPRATRVPSPATSIPSAPIIWSPHGPGSAWR